jgi:hypothetical protein
MADRQLRRRLALGHAGQRLHEDDEVEALLSGELHGDDHG